MKEKLAELLLSIKAVELRPNKLFTWASGLKSPIYCDNRKTLSYPQIRNTIKNTFVKTIKQQFPTVNYIAGVATGAIAHAVLVAQAMDLPFIYIRNKAKQHGQQNLIEGQLKKNAKIVVIEDLISTGQSSITAIKELQQLNTEVLGLTAIFSYNFQQTIQNFKEIKCEFHTLTDYNTLINIALQKNYIQKTDIDFLQNWRKSVKNSI